MGFFFEIMKERISKATYPSGLAQGFQIESQKLPLQVDSPRRPERIEKVACESSPALGNPGQLTFVTSVSYSSRRPERIEKVACESSPVPDPQHESPGDHDSLSSLQEGDKKNPPVREGSDGNLADQIDGLTAPPVKHLTIAKTIDPIIPIDIITMKIIIPSITAF